MKSDDKIRSLHETTSLYEAVQINLEQIGLGFTLQIKKYETEEKKPNICWVNIDSDCGLRTPLHYVIVLHRLAVGDVAFHNSCVHSYLLSPLLVIFLPNTLESRFLLKVYFVFRIRF